MFDNRFVIRALEFMASLGQPGPDISWITTLLAVSGVLYSRHLFALGRMGIGAIVSLRMRDPYDPRLMALHGFHFLHLPVPDYDAPSLEQLITGSQWVAEQVESGCKVLVHCKKGVGRSVVLICGTLLRFGYSLEEALTLVRSRRWGVDLTATQLESLREFERHLRFVGP